MILCLAVLVELHLVTGRQNTAAHVVVA